MKRLICAMAVLLLSACGFSPMYGTSSGASNISTKTGFSQIAVSTIPDRDGQFLKNALMDRLYYQGEPVNPKYQLSIDEITETIANFDLTLESAATRRQLRLTSTILLTDIETNETALKRSLLAITSHNILDSEFSTLITEQSAREAALNDLARQIERQLALYFSR